MNLNYLQTLLIVEESGSFSAAARKIGLTQPAVSMQIQTLEEEMGTQLVVRDARTCQLTSAGSVLADFARETFIRLKQTKIRLDRMSGEISGVVRLGGSNIPGEHIMGPIIAEFRRRYPQVSFELSIGDSKEIYHWLEAKRIDIGIMGQRELGEKYQWLPVASDRLLLVVPHDHPWANREITVSELDEYYLVDREEGSATRKSYQEALGELGIRLEELPVSLKAGSTGAVLAAVRAGMGYAFCSRWALKDLLTLEQVAIATLPGVSPERNFYAAINLERFRTLATDAFLEYLRVIADDFAEDCRDG